ncbi:MAG: hypothetical protein PWQ67_1231 [Clostridia bacterium]|jgi:hypothetical protein|nr:hypothetical protein [Clostridia bacterium]MDN5322777.1 hypothetical protein [Clostridia bacterium]
MRRRKRSEDVVYGKVKRDTEYAQDLMTKSTKQFIKQADVSKFANNPRPKYEIYPGE